MKAARPAPLGLEHKKQEAQKPQQQIGQDLSSVLASQFVERK